MGWDFTPAPHKGDVYRRRVAKAKRKEDRRMDRAARRADRAETGRHGPDIDWDAAVASVKDTSVEGVIKTISRP